MAKTSRTEIVAAARDLIRDKGYAGTSMKDLAERVGILKSSLYSHFAAKEDLVPEVLQLTYGEIAAACAPSGDWRADYGSALDALVCLLTANRRCIGMHLAYGLDETTPALREAVGTFFLDLRRLFRETLRQGLDADLAESLALDTLAAVEGATLWLALYGNDAPMRAAKEALLARADSHAAEPPGEKARQVLDRMLGDWRRASLTEKRLAERAVAAEEELLTARAALAGRIEVESCFR